MLFVLPLSLSSGRNHSPDGWHYKLGWPAFEFMLTESYSIQYMLFFAWIMFVNIFFMRFNGFLCSCGSFSLLTVLHSLVWVYQNVLIHSPADSHLVVSCTAIMNSAAINILAHAFQWTFVCISLGYVTQHIIGASQGVLMFNFTKYWQILSQSIWTSLFSPSNIESFSCSTPLTLDIVFFFNLSYSVEMQWYSIAVLICISLMTKWGPFTYIYNTYLDILFC